MKTSQIGIDAIKFFEGFKSKPYLCPANIATIGYGTTITKDGKRVKITDKPISEIEASELLQSTLITYENIVTKKITRELKPNEFDALVCFTYNTGGSKTLFEMVNSQNPLLKAWWISHYITGGGKQLKGLIERRKAEAKLYFYE